MIQILTDAAFANHVLNHPAVFPDVATSDAPIDVSPCIDNPNNLILAGERGIFHLTKLFEGCWETHTAVLPEGRGRWAREFAEAGARYMFAATDCVELLTRVPEGHVAASTLTLMMGFRHQFKTPPECRFRGKLVPCDIYSLTLQDWALRAPEVEERGAAFHEWLNTKVSGQPHEPDPAHNRVVGIALDMINEGQPVKATFWYNRWAFTARHKLITLLGVDPVQVKFDAGVLTCEDGHISVEPCH
jgi:hypothetical protein